jgi:four helix bundle protein
MSDVCINSPLRAEWRYQAPPGEQHVPRTMNDFRKLKAWHKAHALAVAVYRATSAFPATERFGLVSQMRRAAVSVPANIAESCGRRSRRDEAHLRQVAFGSACELEAELLLALDLGFLPREDHRQLHTDLIEVKRMLGKLALRTFAQPPWVADA